MGSTLQATISEHNTTTQASALDLHPTWSLLFTKTSVLQPPPPRRRHLGYCNVMRPLWTLTSSRKTKKTILTNILTSRAQPPRDKPFGPWGAPSGNGPCRHAAEPGLLNVGDRGQQAPATTQSQRGLYAPDPLTGRDYFGSPTQGRRRFASEDQSQQCRLSDIRQVTRGNPEVPARNRQDNAGKGRSSMGGPADQHPRGGSTSRRRP